MLMMKITFVRLVGVYFQLKISDKPQTLIDKITENSNAIDEIKVKVLIIFNNLFRKQ
jgi:hypothetical protein